MVNKVAEILQEYQDLFLMKFSEKKGILNDIGVIKIPLKDDAKPVKQRPYRLNPKYKEKFRMELDKMLAAGIMSLLKSSNGSALWWYKKRRPREKSESVLI